MRSSGLTRAVAVARDGNPSFPDPVFTGNGRIGQGIGKGEDPNSPAFQHAEQVCGNP
ncbi:MAG: hypothetical protein ACXVRN_11620 [Solirubrobacteraceae bacterium]